MRRNHKLRSKPPWQIQNKLCKQKVEPYIVTFEISNLQIPLTVWLTNKQVEHGKTEYVCMYEVYREYVFIFFVFHTKMTFLVSNETGLIERYKFFCHIWRSYSSIQIIFTRISGSLRCSSFFEFLITHCSHLSGDEENPISHGGMPRLWDSYLIGFSDSFSVLSLLFLCCCGCSYLVLRTIWNHNYRCVYLNLDAHC